AAVVGLELAGEAQREGLVPGAQEEAVVPAGEDRPRGDGLAVGAASPLLASFVVRRVLLRRFRRGGRRGRGRRRDVGNEGGRVFRRGGAPRRGDKQRQE